MTHSKTQREAIGARLRYEVLRRCNFACYYCGLPGSLGIKQLHIDHVVPVDLGGTNDPSNLVASCWDCNAGKANGVPTYALVTAVRQAEADYQVSLGMRVIPCRFCSMPTRWPPEDEDAPTECAMCNAVMFFGYDAGTGAARPWMGPL